MLLYMLMLTSCKLGKLTGRRANKRVLRSIVPEVRPQSKETEQEKPEADAV